MTTTTQQVVGALKAGGFVADKHSRRERRPGFHVMKMNPAMYPSRARVGVTFWTETAEDDAARALTLLVAAGFDAEHPSGRNNGCVVVR